MRGDLGEQEVVARVRAVALEGLGARHLVGGLVHGLDHRGGQRPGHVADAEVDQPRLGMSGSESGGAAPDLGKEVAGAQALVVRVDLRHRDPSTLSHPTPSG